MSNLNTEKEYDNLFDGIDFSVSQILKSLYVALPAIIDSYNSETRRAVIQIAVNQVMTDETETSYPLLADVPIIFPSTKSFTMTMPLKKGDAVMLLFSQRGIGAFKETYKAETPSKESFFSLHDSVAIAGFGALSITPAQTDAMTLQSSDGTTYIALKDNEVTITASNINLNGNISINGFDFQDHIHSGVTTGGDVSGGVV